MASLDHAGSVARSDANSASSESAAASANAGASGAASLDAGTISARPERLPATRSIWMLVVLLSPGLFFELYDLLYSGYIAPGLVKSGMLSVTPHGLFGSPGVASFSAALFSGLYIGAIACGFLADLFGRRAVFTYSLLWYTAANVWRFVAYACGIKGVNEGSSGFALRLVANKSRFFNPRNLRPSSPL